MILQLQWSLYFKTTHGTKKMWSYIAGGLKIRSFNTKLPFGIKSSGFIIKGGLKIEGLLYTTKVTQEWFYMKQDLYSDVTSSYFTTFHDGESKTIGGNRQVHIGASKE